MIVEDPWGGEEPPATAGQVVGPLPARLAELDVLTRPRELAEEEPFWFPAATELPEVAALVEHGWLALDAAPLHACLPAVWPPADRCWVPDRLPKVSYRVDGQRHWVQPWSPQDRAMAREDLADIATECGLAPAPPGRIWLLRSPWATIAVDVVLHLIGLRCEERNLMLLSQGYTTAARELLGWDEEDVWAWWPGPTGTIARAWRRQGRTGPAAAPVVLAGLGPDDVGALAEHGLTEAQAVAWAQALELAGADAVEQVSRWRALGLPADPPPELAEIAVHLTIPQVEAWLAAGFSLDAVHSLGGLDVAAAVRWREAGLSPGQTRQVLHADPTVSEAELQAFDAAGIGWPDRLNWIAHGFDAATADQWRHLDVTPMLARVWRSVSLTAQDALTHAGHGEVGLPPGIQPGWFGHGDNPRERHYDVQDPPGTRGRIARHHHTRDS